MAYVFNEEDKVKWSELSPSLQARFAELEDMRYSLTVNSQDRIKTTRLTKKFILNLYSTHKKIGKIK